MICQSVFLSSNICCLTLPCKNGSIIENPAYIHTEQVEGEVELPLRKFTITKIGIIPH